jgi:hypothetical protein
MLRTRFWNVQKCTSNQAIFFYGSRITVLTFSLLNFYVKNSKDVHRIKLFGTGAVQPVYFELLQKLYLTFLGGQGTLFEDDLEIFRSIATSRQDCGKKELLFSYFFLRLTEQKFNSFRMKI